MNQSPAIVGRIDLAEIDLDPSIVLTSFILETTSLSDKRHVGTFPLRLVSVELDIELSDNLASSTR